MSFNSWHSYGYGFPVSEPALEGLKELISQAPETKEMVIEALGDILENSGEDLLDRASIDNFEDVEIEDVALAGFGPIIAAAITEIENIRLACVNNFDGDQFVIFVESYPWQLTLKERNLTEETLYGIIKKYVELLYPNEEIEIDYQSVENGG